MEEPKTYKRSTSEGKLAKALVEELQPHLDEIANDLVEQMGEKFTALEERLEKLEERLKSLEGSVDAKLEDLEDWDAGGFAAQLDEIEDTLKDPIIRACLRGAA
jgi:flagellar motility protein MotE (MotC chaperone)